MKKFFKSLLAKYMLIIFMAIFLVQFAFLFIGTFFMSINSNLRSDDEFNPSTVEEKWHEEANQFQTVDREKVFQHFSRWKKQYPFASMFWVDEKGTLLETVNPKEEIPQRWTPAFTAKFIKERYGGEPFTVIAFLGKNEANGFIVLELPREKFQPPLQQAYNDYAFFVFIGMGVIILLFVFVSFLFFNSIRKRLLNLQESMTIRDLDGIPAQTNVKKIDEIGQLEQTFNEMVQELKEGKQREKEEEQLRRELIANLSHDLRTPLTKMRAQIYSLEQEKVSEERQISIEILEASIVDIDRLIENLMSYTLLMASRYKLERKDVDVIRYVRECLATWYQVFEKEGFDIEVELQPFNPPTWFIDPTWLSRIIDNLLQNVLRHARSGRYIQVKTESTSKYDAFLIIDRGQGMQQVSNEKGAGIGLSIVDMMVKGMDLHWEISSTEHGTMIKIMKFKKRVSKES